MTEIFEDINNYNYIENNNIEIIYESDCKNIISLDKNACYNNNLKNILPILNKLLVNIDDTNKIEIHKLISSNFLYIKKFKTVSLLPGYVTIFNLYKNNNCLFTELALKLLFNIELSSNKITDVGKILSNDSTFTYEEKIIKYGNGWCYLIFKDDFLNNTVNLLICRIFIFNFLNKECNIPTHFKIKKNIDMLVYVVLKFFNIMININTIKTEKIKYLINKKNNIDHYEKILFDKLIKHNNNRIKFYTNVLEHLKNNIKEL